VSILRGAGADHWDGLAVRRAVRGGGEPDEVGLMFWASLDSLSHWRPYSPACNLRGVIKGGPGRSVQSAATASTGQQIAALFASRRGIRLRACGIERPACL